MIDSDTPEPLRNIPINIVVDGVEITGEILFARFNDISVVRPWHRPARAVVQIRLPAVRARDAVRPHRTRRAGSQMAAQGAIRLFTRATIRLGYLTREPGRSLDGNR
jgi:hypothetical protein